MQRNLIESHVTVAWKFQLASTIGKLITMRNNQIWVKNIGHIYEEIKYIKKKKYESNCQNEFVTNLTVRFKAQFDYIFLLPL